MKNILILGATGSIGRQALQVMDQHPDKFNLIGITAQSNIALLEEQARRYRPRYVAVVDGQKALLLKKRLADLPVEVFGGEDALKEIACVAEYDILLTAVVGFSGLLPTLEAIKKGCTIALANKETLVAAGEFVMGEAKDKGAVILPVDSEHSAIYQCLQGERQEHIGKLILTASGGPFHGYNRGQLQGVGPQEALKHPRWNMGKKISIDSATLMNKGLEIIEAHFLFDVAYENIDVVVHPQSIIHSLVEFVDGSQIAQLGLPDMALPILYALTYPERWPRQEGKLQLHEVSPLTFFPPATEVFSCLDLARQAGTAGGTLPAVLNAANEVAVESFLRGEVDFLQIAHIIEEVMSRHKNKVPSQVSDILDADYWARQESLQVLDKKVR